MKNNKFSIIICVYNLEKYVATTIESVLNQDFTDYELIIVNDGSTDNSMEVIKSYKDSRIRVIDNGKNKGLGTSRNVGVSNATGEYILYLDGDDTLFENSTLSKINEVISKSNPDIAYFGVKYIGGSNKTYLPNAENSTREARLICDMHFAVSSKCFRREFLAENDIKFISKMYYEDMVYSIKAAIFAKKLDYGEFPIYNYVRNREGSIMATPNIKRCSDMYRMLSYLVDLYEITPEEYKPYLLSFIKNETLSLPYKNKEILRSMKNKDNAIVFPKRNYQFDPTDEEVNI